MSVWRTIVLVSSVLCVLLGLFNKHFKPIGFTTKLMWGESENAQIPRWIAGPFYVVLGLIGIYWAVTGK